MKTCPDCGYHNHASSKACSICTAKKDVATSIAKKHVVVRIIEVKK